MTFRVHLEGGNGEDSEMKKRDTKERSSCFEAISSDPDIKGAIGKICAHLETNSRQCQVRTLVPQISSAKISFVFENNLVKLQNIYILIPFSGILQSLRKRFSIYSFLWEQDVGATFADFMRGQATPHPRRFTRPETVRSRASARVHSGRPKRYIYM